MRGKPIISDEDAVEIKNMRDFVAWSRFLAGYGNWYIASPVEFLLWPHPRFPTVHAMLVVALLLTVGERRQAFAQRSLRVLREPR
jgi:hypothetical protein